MASTTPLNSPSSKATRPDMPPVIPKFSFKAAFGKPPCSSSTWTGMSSSPSKSKLPSLRSKLTSTDQDSSLGKRRNPLDNTPQPKSEFGVLTRATLKSKLPGPPPTRMGSLATPRTGSASPSGKVARSESLRDVHARGRTSPSSVVGPPSAGLPRPGTIGTLPKSRSRVGISLIGRNAQPTVPVQGETRKRTQSATEGQTTFSPNRIGKPNIPPSTSSRVLRPPAGTISAATSTLPKRQPVMKRSRSIDLSTAAQLKPSKGSIRRTSIEKVENSGDKDNQAVTRFGPPPSFFGSRPTTTMRQKRSSLPVAATLGQIKVTEDTSRPPSKGPPSPKSSQPTFSSQATPKPVSSHIRTNSTSSAPSKRPDLGIASSILKAHPITHPMLLALQQKQPYKPINTPDAVLKAKKRISGVFTSPLKLPAQEKAGVSSSRCQTGLRFPSKDEGKAIQTPRDSEVDAELLASLRIVAKKANWNMQEVEVMVQADKRAREAKERAEMRASALPPQQVASMSNPDCSLLSPSKPPLRNVTPTLLLPPGGEEEELLADTSAAVGDQSLDLPPPSDSDRDSPLLKLAVLRPERNVCPAQAVRIKRALRQSLGLEALLAQQQHEELLGVEFEDIQEIEGINGFSRSDSGSSEKEVVELTEKVERLCTEADETVIAMTEAVEHKSKEPESPPRSTDDEAPKPTNQDLKAQLAELQRSQATLQAELATLRSTPATSDRQTLDQLELEVASTQASAVKRLGLVELEELQNQADALMFCRFQLDGWQCMVSRAGARLHV